MIKYLLFDADDTLFDFKKCESHAFAQTCRQHGLNNTLLYDDYLDINRILWAMFELKQITIDELVIERYRQLFTKHGITITPGLFNIQYLSNLGKAAYLLDGADDLCRDLYQSGKYEMYIVTNGVASTQISRFYDSPLRNYFKDIFISEKIGYQKPSVEYFEYVINHSNIVKDETLIIGDSLTSDIRGGNNAGILTCWYNPDYKTNDTNCKCDYIIHELNELRSILSI